MAVGAAGTFALFSPVGKWLVGSMPALQVSGISYLFFGLILLATLARRSGAGEEGRLGGSLRRADLPFLALSVVLGGVAGPVLLLLGLERIAAYHASLLLNLEAVFTVTAGILIGGERPGWRGITGAAGIIGAGVLIALGTAFESGSAQAKAPLIGSLLVAGACLGWALDNTVCRWISHRDPRQIAMVKGLVAGPATLMILTLAAPGDLVWPSTLEWFGLGVVGGVSLGLSLVFYLLSLRYIGIALTGAFFALTTPMGFALSILLLRERPGAVGFAALILSALATLLLATDRHRPLPVHPSERSP
jgi:drug/metabolite transporter (DMT)-like permease